MRMVTLKQWKYKMWKRLWEIKKNHKMDKL